MRGVSRLRGLGATWKLDDSGNWVDCDLWSNVFNFSVCWNPLNAQLAGPNAPNPMAPSNPITQGILGATPGTGQQTTASDYVSAYLSDPSNILMPIVLFGGGVVLLLLLTRR